MWLIMFLVGIALIFVAALSGKLNKTARIITLLIAFVIVGGSVYMEITTRNKECRAEGGQPHPRYNLCVTPDGRVIG